MTTFDKREEAFENKFAHDEGLRFKAVARGHRLLGLWAAEKLGLSGDEAKAYAKSVVLSDFEEAGDHDVVRKVLSDFAAANLSVSEPLVRQTMHEMLGRAVREIQDGV